MSNFSKIVIIVLIIMSFFFIKEKYGSNIENILSSFNGFQHIEFNKNKKINEIVKNPVKINEKEINNQEKAYAEVYFLALDANDNGIYKKVRREIPLNTEKIDYAIKELLKGPNMVEKTKGAYTEIPKSTKLLSIKQTNDKVIIDFSDDFQYGGGTDSIYSRMMQLIKTAVNNTENKKIYLYLDGKQVNIIGGEGIMITQPLTEKSLEI